ncbi:MAG: (4Fe-4S)-binding protein [Actinomycetota bacterium]|nr:(4Fe-4S)-binding protein [Actinomycetota bacterium]
MAHGIEIRVDKEVCMGSGNCVFWASSSFDLDDDGRSCVLDPEATDEERLLVVAGGCPVGAISLWRNGRRIDTGAP